MMDMSLPESNMLSKDCDHARRLLVRYLATLMIVDSPSLVSRPSSNPDLRSAYSQLQTIRWHYWAHVRLHGCAKSQPIG
jgi:hypothetical protein